MLETKKLSTAFPLVDISTTATLREAIETHTDEPVIISAPIGGDASEFE